MNTGLNINGVTVIKKTEIIREKGKNGWIIPVFFMFWSALLVGAAELLKNVEKATDSLWLTPILFLLCIFVFIGFWIVILRIIASPFCTEHIPTGSYSYKVTISPEVSFTEITKLYNVTENSDGTYTLTEKEEKE